MSTCIRCMNTRDQPGNRGGNSIQLHLVLPLCLLPQLHLHQPELLCVYILHLHLHFPLFCFLLSPLFITISTASPDLLLLFPCLVILTLFLLLTPFVISSGNSLSSSHLLFVSLYLSSPANFLSGHVANVANLLHSGSAAPKSWPSVSRWLKPGQQLLSDWQGS